MTPSWMPRLSSSGVGTCSIFSSTGTALNTGDRQSQPANGSNLAPPPSGMVCATGEPMLPYVSTAFSAVFLIS